MPSGKINITYNIRDPATKHRNPLKHLFVHLHYYYFQKCNELINNSFFLGSERQINCPK